MSFVLVLVILAALIWPVEVFVVGEVSDLQSEIRIRDPTDDRPVAESTSDRAEEWTRYPSLQPETKMIHDILHRLGRVSGS